MNQSLLEVMAPILEPIIQQKEEDAMARGMERGMARGMKDGMARGMKDGMAQGMKDGMAQGIQGTISILREFGHPDPEIRAAIMKKYDLSSEEAEKYLRKDI